MGNMFHTSVEKFGKPANDVEILKIFTKISAETLSKMLTSLLGDNFVIAKD